MIQLQILSGKKAGTVYVPESLPMTAGRAGTDLHLPDDGVWSRHFVISTDPDQGVIIRAEKDALLHINRAPVLHAVLHTGDQITAGLVTMRFDLGPVTQAGLQTRESILWCGLVCLVVLEIALILKLPHH